MKTTMNTGAVLGTALVWLVGVAVAYGDNRVWHVNPASNFTCRQEITISGSLTEGILTNFPLLVAITNQDNPIFASAQSSGNDIAFTTADGLTKLAHEIESYTNAGTKRLVAWVTIPMLSAGQDTTIQMFYGNPSLPNQQNVADVWTNHFLGVWHLNEAVSAGETNRDSSSSRADAVRYGSGVGSAEGKIGGGNAYNGSDDRSISPGVTVNGDVGFTLSAWVYRDENATGTTARAVEGSDGAAYYMGVTGNPYYPLLTVRDTNSTAQQCCYGNPGVITVTNWHYYVAVAFPGRLGIYVDGVNQTHSEWGQDPYGLFSHVRAHYIGCSSYLHSDGWLGRLDEFRLCGVARSESWIKACYNNQNKPGAYLALGPELRNGQWECRQKITIASSMISNTDQTDLPVLVLITNQQHDLFLRAQNNGGDILFTAADGTSKLSHEIESYTNSGNKLLAAWVRVPFLSHEDDTELYMYYGNQGALRQENAAHVWANNFLGVWHPNEAVTAGGTNYDSSLSKAHAVRHGSAASETAGKIGGGNAYNGTDDFAQSPGVIVSSNGYTISAWIYRAAEDQFRSVEGGNIQGLYMAITESPYYLLSSVLNSNSILQLCYGWNTAATVKNWHYYVSVATPSRIDVYIDGVNQTHPDWGPVNGLAPAIRGYYIGRSFKASMDDGWNGCLDEFRVCDTPRSADWIMTCYRNQNAPDTYMSFGRIEGRTRGTSIMIH
ncbi:MAG: DUF2341 domain-containing protein [Kiritimatiellae bacterium]|nr:DUF2341 domain-containing protein [Kiritimatiellia bacterium]